MTAPLPKPLTPPDSTVAHLPSMLLDVQRIRDSSIANHENPEVFRASFLLWCAAWQQTPAASLDNKDRELASMAGFNRAMGEWMKIKDEVMSSFVLCADGRWYHPVVAEKALEQMLERLTVKAAGAKGNASQGKAMRGGQDLQADMADIAVRLRALNPRATVLTKPAVVEALSRMACQEGEAGDSGDDPARTNGEQIAPPAETHGEPTAPAPRTHGVAETDAVRTHGDRTANAPRTQGERSADAKEKKRIESPLPPLEGGDALDEGSRFDEAFRAFHPIGQTKYGQAEGIWPDIAAQAGGQANLLHAVKDYTASVAAKAREGRGIPSILTWLKRGDWKAHLPAEAKAEAMAETASSWAGPEDVRADVVAHIATARNGDKQAGEIFAKTYLDPCGWRDLPERTIVCSSRLRFDALRSQCGALLKHLGVTLVLETMEAAA